MSKSLSIVVAAAVLLVGPSLATAKIRGVPARTVIDLHPGINETSRPMAVDPHYRLSEPYYSHSDPLHGLFDFNAVPPFSPGYNYGHVRPLGWR